MASPSLGTNLSVDPFAPFLRSKRGGSARTIAEENTGFSDDGLSYEVARDFPKIAAQALAAYEAAIGHERQKGLNIDNRGIVTSTPVDAGVQDRIYRETIEPTAMFMGLGGGRGNQSQLRTYETDSGDIIGIDPRTGRSSVVYDGPAKPVKTPNIDEIEFRSALALQRALAGNMLANPKRVAEVDTQVNELRKRLATPAAPQTNFASSAVAPLNLSNIQVPTVPAYTANWPQQGSFMGIPGGTNVFDRSFGAPMTRTNMAPFTPTNASPTIIRTGSGKAFKVSPPR